jgi:hypothetical protein
MDISLSSLNHTGTSTPTAIHTEMPSISSNSLFKTTFYPFPRTHIFFIKSGGQSMDVSSKGGYPTMFSTRKTMQFYKTGHWVEFIKTRAEACIKGRD